MGKVKAYRLAAVAITSAAVLAVLWYWEAGRLGIVQCEALGGRLCYEAERSIIGRLCRGVVRALTNGRDASVLWGLTQAIPVVIAWRFRAPLGELLQRLTTKAADAV